jgi:hypothetical protein
METKNTLLNMLDWVLENEKRAKFFRNHVSDAMCDDCCTDTEFVEFVRDCIRECVDSADMFSAIVGREIEEIVGFVREEEALSKVGYKIEIHLNNLRHKDWWTWGSIPIYYTFGSLSTVLLFLRDHKLVRPQDEEFITKQDARLETGRLACTSWYTITKGEESMTEYTSL